MNTTRLAGAALVAMSAFVLLMPHVVHADMASEMKVLDTDSDGTLSLDEVQAAAGKKFTALDPDGDGTIDKKEAKGTFKKGAFGKADPDKDGTIDKAEFLYFAETLFKKADTDGDGTLDTKELASKPGMKLFKMMD